MFSLVLTRARLSAAAFAVAVAAALTACDSGQQGSGSGAAGITPPPVPEAGSIDAMSWTWPDRSFEGWVLNDLPVEVTWPEGGGIGVLAPRQPEYPDIFIRSPALSIPGRDFTRIVVDLETIVPGAQPDLAIYYTTPARGEAFEFRGAPQDASLPEAGERRRLVYDMTRLAAGGSDWVDSTITGIRFDLPQGAGSHHIIRAIHICSPDAEACS